VVEEDLGAHAEPAGMLVGSDGGRRRRAMVRPSDTVVDSGTSLSPWSGKPLDGPRISAEPSRCSRWRHRGGSIA
jgi:hypothetical protein